MFVRNPVFVSLPRHLAPRSLVAFPDEHEHGSACYLQSEDRMGHGLPKKHLTSMRRLGWRANHPCCEHVSLVLSRLKEPKCTSQCEIRGIEQDFLVPWHSRLGTRGPSRYCCPESKSHRNTCRGTQPEKGKTCGIWTPCTIRTFHQNISPGSRRGD